jgi:antitoxin (DNA-binding transcriptional repressor) of toxin-antitoxin stability system
MTIIATGDLANQIEHILEALATGEEFLIMDAGHPVARIVPALPSETRTVQFDESWQQELDEWRQDAQSGAGRYPPGFVLDDSRETIYGEWDQAQR